MAGTRTGSSPYAHAGSSGVFVDRFGNTHELLAEHRSLIKPGWRRVVAGERDPAGEESAGRRLGEMGARIRLAAGMLATAGCELRGTRVLDVGCGDGAESLLLARSGASRVVATNHGRLHQDGGNGHAGVARAAIARALAADAGSYLDRPAAAAAPIDFVDDDIACSVLETASFDVVCSWETLEHLPDPLAAFTEMHRLLRPGGWCYHEYNPFFCIEGGHSLCTLDFPWGHVRLSGDDFDRYVETLRPAEADAAKAYYRDGLNRVSLDQMQACCRKAGFEIAFFVPRSRTEDLMALSKPIHDQARRNYPRLTINDLVCRMVRLVLRKPAGPSR
jgi:SAM-dependent methyltransferase